MLLLTKTPRLMRRGDVWYYRRAVPKNHQAEHGKVIQYSLKTTDRREAIKRREVLDVEWRRRFDDAVETRAINCKPTDARMALNDAQAERLIQDHVTKEDSRRREAFAAKEMPTDDERRNIVDDLRVDLAVARGSARGRDCDEALAIATNRIVGTDPHACSSEAVSKLVRRALVELSERSLDRWTGRHDRPFIDELFNPSRPKAINVGELAEQFLLYEEEDALAHGHSEKSADKTRASVSLVVEMLGSRTLVREIDYDRCRSFCNLLARVPTNRTKVYRGLPLLEAVERAEVEGRPTLSAITQQQYLATLKQLLELAVMKDILRSNPSGTLRPLTREAVSARDRRLPFSIDQIRAFFASDFYRRCARDGDVPYRQAKQAWRFWLPLIALFMGMRPKEICQLHVADVKETEHGNWYVSVQATDDSDPASSPRKTTKTRASRRDVPLHPELVALGFLLFVDQRQRTGDVCLFGDLTRNKYDDPAAYPLRRLRELMAREMDLKERQSFYSFRHTWADAVRALNPPRDFLQAVGAWEQDTTTSDNYGSHSHPDRYAAIMEQVRFEGLDLSHLHVDHAPTRRRNHDARRSAEQEGSIVTLL